MTALPKSIESHLIWRHTVQLLVQAPMASLLERTMEILMKRFPFVASLSLIIPEVECFVVFGGSRSSSGGCCSGRRLHDANGHITAPNAHGGKLTSLLHVGANERRMLVYGSGLIAPSRVRKVRQDRITLTPVLSTFPAVIKRSNIPTTDRIIWLANPRELVRFHLASYPWLTISSKQ